MPLISDSRLEDTALLTLSKIRKIRQIRGAYLFSGFHLPPTSAAVPVNRISG